MSKITSRDLKTALVIGPAAIVGWFLAAHTTLLLAYGKGGSYTLSQVQGICDSGLGLLARSASATGAANCASVDHYAMWANIAGFAGLVMTLVAGGVLLYRRAGRGTSEVRETV